MRASRETELAAVHPVHVVADWLGNSAAIAAKHYLQVTESDFAKAVQNPVQPMSKAVQNPVQPMSADNAPISAEPQVEQLVWLETADCGGSWQSDQGDAKVHERL